MENRNTTEEKLFSYRQVAYDLGISPYEVWTYLRQRGVTVSDKMLFTKEHLIRLGLFKEKTTEIYYIYESKMNAS